MKTLIAIGTGILLSGCAGFDRANQVNQWLPYTSPGSELPSTSALFNYCDQKDEQGLCKKWHYGSGEIRPYDVPPGKPAVSPKP